MIIRIDPSLPLCWESTDTLRVGFEQAEVRLRDPSPRQQRFISLLQRGLLTSDLPSASRKTGVPARERAALLDALAPVLQRIPAKSSKTADETAEHTGRGSTIVEIIGDGGFAAMLRAGFLRAGFEVSDASDGTPAFTVLVERFICSAAKAQHLLICEVPHLPVLLTDRSMVIGPLIMPQGAPCLACVELQEAEEDPLRSTLAAQLLGVRPAAESPACAEVAAALCASLIRQQRLGIPDLCQARLRFPVRGGVPGTVATVERIVPHRECACVTLSQSI